MEICDLERSELELAVEMGIWLGTLLSIINVQGLDVSYSNFYLVSQPFHEESVFLSPANNQEKNSKVAEELVCVWDSVTSPLAFWAAQGYAAQANVGGRAAELFCVFPLQWLELRLNSWAGFSDVQ